MLLFSDKYKWRNIAENLLGRDHKNFLKRIYEIIDYLSHSIPLNFKNKNFFQKKIKK
jgi:hypothetical protein